MKSPAKSSTKICARCKQVKPLAEFGKHDKHADGHKSWCRQCCCESYRDYRKKLPRFDCRAKQLVLDGECRTAEWMREHGAATMPWRM